MKIQLVEPGEKDVIETFDLANYNLDDENELEILKDDLGRAILDYIEGMF
tara:strand:+ start:180 stop:329 length:150 start_codon:yes stop_codon:yes gene_type:complete